MTSSASIQFLAAMQSRDLALREGKQLIADGEWHRCAVINKPSSNSDGSYKLHTDGPVPWGLYRNWTDGKGVDHWRGDLSRALTAVEQQELVRRTEQARIEDANQAIKQSEQAAEKAQRLWQVTKPAPADHPYLKRKGIKPHGVHVSKYGWLLVPLYDLNDELVNLQYIADDGHKWFLKGGRAKGCGFRIPGSLDQIVEVEGFATGATTNEAIGCCVAVAFSAGNLEDVAKIIRNELNSLDASLWVEHQKVAAESGLQHEHRPKFFNTKFVIAADDDWKTKDNPGLMAALTAARAAKALIAVPNFGKDRKNDDTDFNDLGRAKGLDAVKAAINKASEPTELLQQLLLADPHSAHGDEMVKQLAALKQHDTVAYERLLAELKKAKVRIRPLEREIKDTEGTVLTVAEEADDLYEHWAGDPWDQPVDTGELLQAVEQQITRYVATLEERAVIVALWVMFTWLHETATHSPMLLATSGEPDCGKSTMLGVIGFMARRALLSVDITGPALFRSLAKWQPTIIVDETDTAFKDNRDLKSVVNSGWTRGQGVIRCDPETNEPRLYSTFAPKAAGMKGRELPDTTLSRSIVIELKRKSANEVVSDFRHADDNELATIRRKLTRWASDNADLLRTAKPDMPLAFQNRTRMNYWPLFAIAELADMKEAAWKAAEAIEGRGELDKATLGQKLLADIRDIFDADNVDEMLSRDLVARLIEDPEKPWAEYRRDKPLTQRQLAGLLAQFGIRSEEVHPDDDNHGKGYKKARFEDAFARYLMEIPPKRPSDPRKRANPSARGVSEHFSSAREGVAARIGKSKLSYSPNDLRGRADRKPVSGGNDKKNARKPFKYRVNPAVRSRRVREKYEQAQRRKDRT